jgi:chaperonin GroES
LKSTAYAETNKYNQQLTARTFSMSKKINLRPLEDRVVVEPVEAEEVTAGGIVLPDTAKEKPQRGTVLAVGPGKLLDSGQRGTLSVSVGDEVIYGKYAGTDIEIDGRDVKILRESDVLAKVVA